MFKCCTFEKKKPHFYVAVVATWVSEERLSTNADFPDCHHLPSTPTALFADGKEAMDRGHTIPNSINPT